MGKFSRKERKKRKREPRMDTDGDAAHIAFATVHKMDILLTRARRSPPIRRGAETSETFRPPRREPSEAQERQENKDLMRAMMGEKWRGRVGKIAGKNGKANLAEF